MAVYNLWWQVRTWWMYLENDKVGVGGWWIITSHLVYARIYMSEFWGLSLMVGLDFVLLVRSGFLENHQVGDFPLSTTRIVDNLPLPQWFVTQPCVTFEFTTRVLNSNIHLPFGKVLKKENKKTIASTVGAVCKITIQWNKRSERGQANNRVWTQMSDSPVGDL